MANIDLSWFCKLQLDDQVKVLADPYHLPEGAINYLNKLPNAELILGAKWARESKAYGLDVYVLDRLKQVRRGLDEWWDVLSKPAWTPDNEQDHLIAHRGDEEPPERYTKLVDDEAQHLGVEPCMVTAYIEMKARQQP